jgi:hypothetical protein
MPQRVLDPEQRAEGDPITPSKPIPLSARDLGKLPDTRDLRPGDIVLFNRIDPRVTHRAIEKVQAAHGFAPEDARWHHAAIYVGRDSVCESTFSGVHFNTMLDRIGTHRLRVRRYPNLGDRERFDIAVQAMSNMRRHYGFKELIALLYGSFEFGARRLASRDFRLICSQVCADAYGVAGIAVQPDLHRRATMPADLSLTRLFQDVSLTWRPIG